MFDSEGWKKFTVRQCLKKFKCVSMRHEKKLPAVNVSKECTPPHWTKTNPPRPIYSDSAPCHQYQCTCKKSTTLSM